MSGFRPGVAFRKSGFGHRVSQWRPDLAETYVITAPRPRPTPPWKRPWSPTPPSQRQMDITVQIAERRAQNRARRQAEQARARERAAQEARQRQRDAERARQREQQARQAIGRARQKRARQQIDAMLRYHRSFGRKWMAERGPFGLTMTMRPIAKYGGKFLGKYMEAGGYVTAALGAPVMGNVGLAASHKMKNAVKEIEKYEAFLEQQSKATGRRHVTVTPDAMKPHAVMKPISKYWVLMKGTVTLQDRIVSETAEAFAYRLQEQQLSNPGMSRALVSTRAHRLVQEIDLPDICRKHGIKAHQVEIEPISGATGRGGGQVRYDVGMFRRRAALIELKSSGYETPRTQWQLQAHHIGVGEKTATYGKPGDYYRILADERRILKWTGEDLARYLRSQRTPTPMVRPPRLR